MIATPAGARKRVESVRGKEFQTLLASVSQRYFTFNKEFSLAAEDFEDFLKLVGEYSCDNEVFVNYIFSGTMKNLHHLRSW
jgi:hypothetical protein